MGGTIVKSKIPNGIISIYLIFLLVSTGFAGLLVFPGVLDEGGVEGATTRYVGGSGPGNYSKIQDAIDNATTGDIIRVYAGIYYENVIVNKSITLIGNGSKNTIIDGGGTGDVIIVDVNWVNISNFNITNSGNSFVSGDGGIKLNYAQNCKINDNNVSNNGQNGICVWRYSKNNTIENNNIFNNGGKGIGLWFYSSNNSIINNILINNSDDGIAFVHNSFNNTVINNLASNNCYNGIYFSSTGNFIANNTVFNNNRGIFNCLGMNNIIVNNTVSWNNDSGIHISTSNTQIINNNISNNKKGIILEFADSDTINNNTISKNVEGIYLWMSENNKFRNNTISNNRIGINHIDGSTHNKFIKNLISKNDRGINISANSNFLYHNNIIDNTIQLYNSGSPSNTWDNGANEGNFWSDYNGLDNGSNGRIAGDGIGDTNLPHQSVDNYPFIRSNGWLFPSTPILLGPGNIDSDGNYTISWYNDLKATGFILEEDKDIYFNSPTIYTEGWVLNVNYNTFNVTEKNENTYYYRCKSHNNIFESDWSNIINITIDYLPKIPQNLKVSNIPKGNALNISWDLNIVDTKEYELEFKNETQDTWGPLVTISHPSFTFNHIDLNDGETYYYRIKARDHRGQESNYSSIVSGVPWDSAPPIPPTGLNVVLTTHNSITLTWNSNLENDIEGYKIYRSEKENPENWREPISTILKESDEFIDTGLEELKTYYYVITAYDEVPNESDFSNIASGTTLPGPHAPEINNSVEDFEIIEDTIDDFTINLYYWFKDINNDPLDFKCEGNENIDVTICKENGTVVLIPKKNWNGREFLTFYANDSVYEISDSVMITVTPVNDPPYLLRILKPVDGIKIDEGKGLDFKGVYDDPDLPYGDTLTLNWYSNITGKLGEGEILNNILLPVGNHLITFEVTDLAGEKTIASIHMSVLETPQSDTDGDGMPNVWERANGLDPDDPNDGVKDPDNDKLSNIEEYNEGTNPQVFDTDVDGLSDFDEIKIYQTNAINPDTDGDGHNDGEDEYPLDPAKWQKEKASTEYNSWAILAAIMIVVIVIIVLIFLFIIRPRKDKGKVSEIMDKTPVVTRKPHNLQPQVQVQPSPKTYHLTKTSPTVQQTQMQPQPQPQSTPVTTQSLTQSLHQKPSTQQPRASQPQTQLSSIFIPQLPQHKVTQPKKTQEPIDIENLLKQGSLAYSQGRYADAIIAWQEILAREPGQHPDIEASIRDAIGKMKGAKDA